MPRPSSNNNTSLTSIKEHQQEKEPIKVHYKSMKTVYVTIDPSDIDKANDPVIGKIRSNLSAKKIFNNHDDEADEGTKKKKKVKKKRGINMHASMSDLSSFDMSSLTRQGSVRSLKSDGGKKRSNKSSSSSKSSNKISSTKLDAVTTTDLTDVDKLVPWQDVMDPSMRGLYNSIDTTTAKDEEEEKEKHKRELKPKKLDPDAEKKVQFLRLLNVKDPEKGCKHVDITKVTKMLDELPKLAKDKFLFTAFTEPITALHMLCAIDAPFNLIKKCYKYNPDAVYDASSAIGSPLHYACWFNASSKTLRYIASKDLDSLMVKNRAKRTPLHLACYRQVNPELVILLTEACPQAAGEIDKDGMTPLHLACDGEKKGKKPDVRVTEDLTEVCPDAVAMQCDINGKTPLHIILEKNSGIDILKDFILSNPKSIKIKDNDGNTPLHSAIIGGCSIKEIKILVKKYPKSCLIKNTMGDTPLRIANTLEVSNDIIDILEEWG